MDYFDIDFKLNKNLKDDLISTAITASKQDYYNHYSSKSGSYTNLQFLFSEKINQLTSKLIEDFIEKPEKIAIIRVNPNKVINWHVDNVKFKRSTVIIFPLTPYSKNYAPCETKQGIIPFYECYAFNTNILHRVVNNSNIRLSLQLFFDIDILEMCKKYMNGSLIHER